MKKFVSLISTALCFAVAVSAVGCNVEPEFDESDFSSAKKPSQIYQSMGYGTEQFFAYEGAITVQMTTETAYMQREDENVLFNESEKESVVCSINPQTREFYVKYTTEEETNGKILSSERVRKVFKDGSEYFFYYAVQYTGYEKNEAPAPQEVYYKVENSYLGHELSDFIPIAKEDFSFRADTFDDLKNAYQTVYAQHLSAEKWRYEDAVASASVTANNTDGKLTVCVATEATTTEKLPEAETDEPTTDQEEEISLAVIKKTTESKRVAKEGKLSSAQESVVLQATKQENGVENGYANEENVELKVEYNFDSAGFSAIQTTRPANSAFLPTLSGSDNRALREYGVDFYVNGVRQTVRVKKEKNVSADKIWSALIEKVGLQAPSEGYLLNGWYKDEELEEKIDEGAWTKDALKNAGEVYGEIQIQDGYAVIATVTRNKDDRSAQYKTVFGSPLKTVEESFAWEVKKIDELSPDKNKKLYYLPDGEVWVNGSKIQSDAGKAGYYTISFESGAFISVEMINVITDNGYSVFETDLSKIVK